MQEKIVIITGGTDGMGQSTAREMAREGARILIIGRNLQKGKVTVADLIHETGNPSIQFMQADLSLVRNVRQLAQRIKADYDRVDVLVHAAGGVFPGRRKLTEEGLELVFAVQFLARFVLTRELAGLLEASKDPRVLSIAGGGAGPGVDFNNLQGEKKYSMFGAIGRASGLNNLLTVSQMSKFPAIAFYNYGPGIVRTKTITRGNYLLGVVMKTLGRPFSQTPDRAARRIKTLLTQAYPGGFYKPALKRNHKQPDARQAEKLWLHAFEQAT